MLKKVLSDTMSSKNVVSFVFRSLIKNLTVVGASTIIKREGHFSRLALLANNKILAMFLLKNGSF